MQRVTVSIPNPHGAGVYVSDAIWCGACALESAQSLANVGISANKIMLALESTTANYCEECGTALLRWISTDNPADDAPRYCNGVPMPDGYWEPEIRAIADMAMAFAFAGQEE